MGDEYMTRSFKMNTLVCTVLAGLFYGSFMFAKHDPRLSTVAPFLNDPYDAIGSFAVISSIIFVAIALVRAFRPYPLQPRDEQKVFLARTQMAIVLAVLITTASDSIAMLRHVPAWAGTPYQGELIGLLSAMIVATIVTGYLVRHSLQGVLLPLQRHWKTTVWIILLAILILALYPEQLIQGKYGHLFTIFVGMLLLFWPLSALVTTLIPFDIAKAAVGQTSLRKVYAWVMVIVFSLGIGLLAFLGEASEGGGSGVPLRRMMVVFAVFLGTGALGIVIGFAFLRKPLGLLR